jgi:hypothetical protein
VGCPWRACAAAPLLPLNPAAVVPGRLMAPAGFWLALGAEIRSWAALVGAWVLYRCPCAGRPRWAWGRSTRGWRRTGRPAEVTCWCLRAGPLARCACPASGWGCDLCLLGVARGFPLVGRPLWSPV